MPTGALCALSESSSAPSGSPAWGPASRWGGYAKSKYDDSNQYCTATSCSSQSGITLEGQAGTFATASTVTVVSGAVLLTVGVTFLIVAPHGSSGSGSVALSSQASPSGGGLSLQGSF